MVTLPDRTFVQNYNSNVCISSSTLFLLAVAAHSTTLESLSNAGNNYVIFFKITFMLIPFQAGPM